MGLRDSHKIGKGYFHIQLLEYRKMEEKGKKERMYLSEKKKNNTSFKVRAAYNNESLNLYGSLEFIKSFHR